eukprot:GSMAST32.ASY1.ANO1.846.1 assembled CDS
MIMSRPDSREPIADVVSQVSQLLGPPALPPRYALGYLGSTMTYTDAPDVHRLREFGTLCEKHQIPCSAFHLSSGYTLDDSGSRNVFTWNRDRVPDPKKMYVLFFFKFDFFSYEILY